MENIKNNTNDKKNKICNKTKKNKKHIKNENNQSYFGFKNKYMFLMFLGTCHT